MDMIVEYSFIYIWENFDKTVREHDIVGNMEEEFIAIIPSI